MSLCIELEITGTFDGVTQHPGSDLRFTQQGDNRYTVRRYDGSQIANLGILNPFLFFKPRLVPNPADDWLVSSVSVDVANATFFNVTVVTPPFVFAPPDGLPVMYDYNLLVDLAVPSAGAFVLGTGTYLRLYSDGDPGQKAVISLCPIGMEDCADIVCRCKFPELIPPT